MITKQGKILRHIQEEFIITFVEMIKIYKRHTMYIINQFNQIIISSSTLIRTIVQDTGNATMAA